ncbi:MAG: hypothetical protein IIA45_05390 [Bacteroidetes bacterium]|nr:hypothetical protein [Bacteroidota bacterium]
MKIQIRSLIIFMLLGLLFRPETSGSVDSKPSFYRGNDTLLQIISKRFVFKESDFETPGDVVVIKLNISERGYLTRISLLREFEYHDSRQMLNIFKTLRVWNPAYQNDKPVRSELIFSIIAYFFSFGEYWYTSLGYGIVFDSQGAYESELIEKFDIPEDTLYVQYDANAIDHYNLQYGRFLSGMSLEYFHKHFKRNKRGAFIKTILVEQSTGDGEIAWLEVKSWDDSTFNCLIPDDLQQIKNLKPGDKILIKKELNLKQKMMILFVTLGNIIAPFVFIMTLAGFGAWFLGEPTLINLSDFITLMTRLLFTAGFIFIGFFTLYKNELLGEFPYFILSVFTLGLVLAVANSIAFIKAVANKPSSWFCTTKEANKQFV